MYSYKSLLLLIIILFSNVIYSQTGPGGVQATDGSSNLTLWLSADYIIQANDTDVTLWNDQSGYNNHATAPGNDPVYTANVLNGNPTVRFTKTNESYLRIDDNASLKPETISIFVVASYNDVSDDWAPFIIKADDWEWDNGYGIGKDEDKSAMICYVNNYLNNDVTEDLDSNTPTIITSIYDQTTIESFYNGVSQGTDNYSSSIDNSDNFMYLGVNPDIPGSGVRDYLDGDITEVIIYERAVNNAEKIIIDNYLSAKYDLALSVNDLYTGDNNTTNLNFDHDVAGIGQASDGSNHADSQGTGIVRVNNPRNLRDNRFVFWGEETKDPTYNFSTNTNNYTEQLNSKWFISRLNSGVGRVDVSFDISSMDLSGKQDCVPLQLVIDNNYNCSSPREVYDLVISGNTATATNVIFRNNHYFTLRYTDQIVWDGSSFYNGSGPANRPDATDDCLKFTIKTGATTSLSSDVHVREVEVETGAKLEINDGILLEVEDVVVIDGEIDLVGEAQLIQNHTTTTSNSGDGFLKIRQQGTTNLYNHNYWSAPTNIAGFWKPGYLEDAAGVISFQSAYDANPATSPITLSSSWLHRFSGKSDNYWEWTAIATTTNLAPGLGYTMKGSGAGTTEQEYVFKGIPNDGDYAFPVTAGNDFLIGNPYPSTLDADQFINDNLSVIDGTLHFWEHFTTNNSHFLKDYQGGYATYNLMMALRAAAVPDDSGLTSGNGTAIKPIPTENIAVGQGFFVTIENTGTLVFNNAQRTFASESAGASIYYKGRSKKEAIQNEDTRTKIWFSFTDPKKINRTIGLGYDSKASKTYDRGYDAKYYEAQRNNIYWSLKGEKFIIQALEKIDIEDELPLLIEATDSGVYTFSINDMNYVPDSMAIYLKDTDQNLYYNLKEGDAQIYLSKSANHEQFSITFNKDNILKITDVANKKIFTSYDAETEELKLHGIDIAYDLQNVAIYNTLGQQIKTYKSLDTDTINLSGFNDGIYFLELNIENTKSTKSIKFIKN